MKEIAFKEMNIKDLRPADYNPRLDLQPGDPDYEALKKSIEEFGFVQNIVWNKRTKRIVGGHQRIKVMEDLGFEKVMVAVVDLDLDHEMALNIGLNKIEGDWDMPKLRDLIADLEASGIDLDLTGFSEPEIEDLLNWDAPDLEEENSYTDKVEIPDYEITSEKPELEDLFNTEKMKELHYKIEKSELSQNEKDFLKFASFRFIEFDYRNIAEYYAHSEKEMQELMEDLALVIIDFNKAIESGFVEFTKTILDDRSVWEEEDEDDL